MSKPQGQWGSRREARPTNRPCARTSSAPTQALRHAPRGALPDPVVLLINMSELGLSSTAPSPPLANRTPESCTKLRFWRQEIEETQGERGGWARTARRQGHGSGGRRRTPTLVTRFEAVTGRNRPGMGELGMEGGARRRQTDPLRVKVERLGRFMFGAPTRAQCCGKFRSSRTLQPNSLDSAPVK